MLALVAVGALLIALLLLRLLAKVRRPRGPKAPSAGDAEELPLAGERRGSPGFKRIATHEAAEALETAGGSGDAPVELKHRFSSGGFWSVPMRQESTNSDPGGP
mmetsp:Transcript_103047/g.300602  ORF Transcript_103047/g.300602 Transcript_103047/m.300602 type:complete len:104 (-) Transcript_103047:142-453(-)